MDDWEHTGVMKNAIPSGQSIHHKLLMERIHLHHNSKNHHIEGIDSAHNRALAAEGVTIEIVGHGNRLRPIMNARAH